MLWIFSTIFIIRQDILEVTNTHLANFCFRQIRDVHGYFFTARKFQNAERRLGNEAKSFSLVPSFSLILHSQGLWKYPEPKIEVMWCQISHIHFQARGELTDTPFTSLVFVNIQWNDFTPSIISGECWQNSMVVKLRTDGNC